MLQQTGGKKEENKDDKVQPFGSPSSQVLK
jgi:hypothetical protein